MKHHSFIKEGDVRVETNNTENPQLNTLSCKKLLSLIKLHHHSSFTSLSYDASSFNSMYKPLTLSFDSNRFKSKVSGMYKQLVYVPIK